MNIGFICENMHALVQYSTNDMLEQSYSNNTSMYSLSFTLIAYRRLLRFAPYNDLVILMGAWRRSQGVRQRSAKPRSPVRIRPSPLNTKTAHFRVGGFAFRRISWCTRQCHHRGEASHPDTHPARRSRHLPRKCVSRPCTRRHITPRLALSHAAPHRHG